VSVTNPPDDGIPHGLKGARKPYYCDCTVCKDAINAYNRERRAARKVAKQAKDELAEKRAKRRAVNVAKLHPDRVVTESDDSVPRVIGAMEKAVIEETKDLARAKERPTMVVAARNLAKIVDNPKMSSIHTSTTKQIMSIMAELRGDTDKAKATGKRKSGGRLATVGQLTKVKRA
jgi:hypothetical protein